jgi:hypothetical protein
MEKEYNIPLCWLSVYDEEGFGASTLSDSPAAGGRARTGRMC